MSLELDSADAWCGGSMTSEPRGGLPLGLDLFDSSVAEELRLCFAESELGEDWAIKAEPDWALQDSWLDEVVPDWHPAPGAAELQVDKYLASHPGDSCSPPEELDPPAPLTPPDTPPVESAPSPGKEPPPSPQRTSPQAVLVSQLVGRKRPDKPPASRSILKKQRPSKEPSSLLVLPKRGRLRSAQPPPEPAIYQCPYCLCVFTKEFEFRFHMSQKLLTLAKKYTLEQAPPSLECTACYETFEHHRDFCRHYANQHPEEVRCSVCELTFHFVCQLNKHQHFTMHFHVEPIQCAECGVDFPNHYCLQSHNAVCHGDVPFSCETCLAPFQNRHKLQCHRTSAHLPPRLVHLTPAALGIVGGQLPRHARKKGGKAITIPLLASTLGPDPAEVRVKRLYPVGSALQQTLRIVPGERQGQLLAVESKVGPPSGVAPQNPVSREAPEQLVASTAHGSGATPLEHHWPCHPCKVRFCSVDNFMTHWGEVHPNDPLPDWLSRIIFSANPKNATPIFVGDQSPIVGSSAEHACPKCPLGFDMAGKLERHVEQEHVLPQILQLFKAGSSEGGPLPCSVCGKGFRHEVLRDMHMLCAHPKLIKFTCPVCNVNFFGCGLYMRHYKEAHHTEGVGMFSCLACGEKQSSVKLMTNHVSWCHGQSTVVCVQCKAHSTPAHFLEVHVKDCGRLACPCCPDQRFARTSQLQLHMLDQHLSKPPNTFVCDGCYNFFYTEFNLSHHRALCSKNSSKPLLLTKVPKTSTYFVKK